ncbi:class I poly(R)-hydroxyalkanoic acid synthase [Thalassotalea ponticola]|uniref:class I poly(R)-hydroxyalkanoic acid synthase n=1 Tax=Thalassotalea ponticola TaxID=1523392 RepID=UPI0025B5D706|nr:class I poly(R)-hydroxyalkanoic acid synthase [Thalassotalea ponticola]MDN3652365.1 class I poly(R)-hydroxyalkanoic acid synthase [Thalassotalea ponticola]
MNIPGFSQLFDSMCQVNQQMLESITKSQQETFSSLLNLQTNDFSSAVNQNAQNPFHLLNQQMKWWQDQVSIFQNTMLRATDSNHQPLVSPEKGDRRFNSDEWHSHPWFDFIKQSYLAMSNNIFEWIDNLPDTDDAQKNRMKFFARQYTSALAPSNFLSLNPEILKLTQQTNGQNLIDGLQLISEDFKRSASMLNISMTDQSAFELGKDLAATPGKVVFKNHLFELLQYQPTTKKVAKRPSLIVPPFVNKYYIMDLSAKKSMVKYLVDQGQTVFMVSWVNPDKQLGGKIDFEDYIVDGVVEALNAVETACGEREVNAIGYCIGGTALVTAMAYMAARRMKKRVQSATLFTTILDFSHPGELGHFINEPMVSAIEQQNAANGIMDGRQLAVSFSLLRENNLYWNYYIDGYLKGKRPVAHELLYWNCDNTHVAGKAHSTMLRHFYLQNELVQTGEFSVRGTPIDLAKVNAPTYFVSTIEDHIALWQGTYQGMLKLGGDKTFVLGQSGHIAGIINPPGGKYGHFTGELCDNADTWFENATLNEGSFWPSWMQWMASISDDQQVAARTLDQSLANAPGDYVRQRIAPLSGDIEIDTVKEHTA